MGAALSVAAGEGGKSIAVTMAYADRLERFTKWWVQLWAESLGKQARVRRRSRPSDLSISTASSSFILPGRATNCSP